MPLKGVPFILSPELLFVLSSAGHGDEIVLADAHFPTSSICASGPKEVRADGHDIPRLLQAILTVYPLDTYVDQPVAVMQVVPSDWQKGMGSPPIWRTYQTLVNEAEATEVQLERVERMQFYERAKKAFAVVHTGETAQYGNIILKKGVILPPQPKTQS